jgi:hypothetical protein
MGTNYADNMMRTRQRFGGPASYCLFPTCYELQSANAWIVTVPPELTVTTAVASQAFPAIGFDSDTAPRAPEP